MEPVALMFDGEVVAEAPVLRAAPGSDPLRPPILR
jgi:hypothetical protein